uniref:centromere-associated protein E-like n=1 Tax=Myxine glutinosa TaxID=7769 RepID=UPI00358E4CF5
MRRNVGELWRQTSGSCKRKPTRWKKSWTSCTWQLKTAKSLMRRCTINCHSSCTKRRSNVEILKSKMELCASKDSVDSSQNKTVTELRSMLEETKLPLEVARSKSLLPATEIESALKVKLTKMEVEYCETIKQQESLKAVLRNKDRMVRHFTERLRKSRDEAHITFAELAVPKSDHHLTEGGGSGTVQNSHILILQDANQALQSHVSELEKELAEVKSGSCVSKYKDAASLYKAEVRRLRSEKSSLSERLQSRASVSSTESTQTPCTPVKKHDMVEVVPFSPFDNLKYRQPTTSDPHKFFSEDGSGTIPRRTRFFDNATLDTRVEDMSPQKVSSLKDVKRLNRDTMDQSPE